MSATRDDGGSAFPGFQPSEGSSFVYADGGMTLRDWFAGQALSGICSDERNMSAMTRVAEAEGLDLTQYVSSSAYEMADAMLAERSKP